MRDDRPRMSLGAHSRRLVEELSQLDIDDLSFSDERDAIAPFEPALGDERDPISPFAATQLDEATPIDESMRLDARPSPGDESTLVDSHVEVHARLSLDDALLRMMHEDELARLHREQMAKVRTEGFARVRTPVPRGPAQPGEWTRVRAAGTMPPSVGTQDEPRVIVTPEYQKLCEDDVATSPIERVSIHDMPTAPVQRIGDDDTEHEMPTERDLAALQEDPESVAALAALNRYRNLAKATMKRFGFVLAVLLLAACGSDAKPMGDDENPPDDPPMNVCGDVTAEGACMGNDIVRCVDGVVEHEACTSTCITQGNVAQCIGPEVCAGVGPLGRCDGETLWRCDGDPSVTDCAMTNQVCGYRDDVVGYGCIDPISNAKRVAGTITWEDRPISPGMMADPVAKPARGVMVAVLDDASNTALATVSAADDGTYVAYYAGTGNVRVTAYSRSRSEARPARVRDTAGLLHAVGSMVFAPGTQPRVDVAITAASTAGGAWNALDNAVTAMDWLRAHGIQAIAPVIIYWQKSTSSGSYYQGANNELHLDGDDGFDDVVALHELGHYVQDEYSDSDNPGGSHDGSPADPRLAWGEGGATGFAIAVRGEPYYMDWSAGGGWSVELETRVHKASLTGAMSQNISEWMVAEVMWDLLDGMQGDADSVDGTVAKVWQVMVGYIISPARVDRGRAGLDLVEFLDGWFQHDGTSTCAGMRTLLRDKYNFPYDLAGPAGVCP